MNRKNETISHLLKITLVFFLAVAIFHFAFYISQAVPVIIPRFDRLMFGIAGTVLIVVLILFARRKLDGLRSWPPVWKSGDARAFGIGAFLFLIPAGIILALAVAFEIVTISVNMSIVNIIKHLVGVLILVFLSEALPEEILFRGYFYNRLEQVWQNTWIIIGAQALLFTAFALLIGAVDSLLDASFLFTFAFILGMCRKAFISLWTSIGFHLAMMTTQQALGPNWDFIVVENALVMQSFILGMIPLTLASAYLYIKIDSKADIHTRKI